MEFKLSSHMHDFTADKAPTTFECLIGSELLRPLGNIDHVDNIDFLDFFHSHILLDHEVSKEAMDGAHPVIVQHEFTNASVLSDSLINWANHALPYFIAVSWFANIYATSGEEAATRLFQKMTLTEKTVIQRGYEIMFLDACPPLPAEWQYKIDLKILDEQSSAAFPVFRMEALESEPVLSQLSRIDRPSSRVFH